MTYCPTCHLPHFNQDTLKDALDKWGPTAQVNQTVEECAELIVALRHHARGKATRDDVASEVADVLVMALQLRLLVGPNIIDREVVAKMKRLEERLG